MRPLAIVTGGSRGIGLAVAEGLILAGFDLLLLSRNPRHLESARRQLLATAPPGIDIQTHALDLGDHPAVIAWAQRHVRPWSLLINNAGIKIDSSASPRTDGIEPHMAINHIGHVTLTHALLKTASDDARIVWVASIVARFSGPKPFEVRSQDVSAAYAASKAANLAYALELDDWFRSTKRAIRSSAAHPGFTKADPYGTRWTRLAENLLAQGCDSGALPILRAALGEHGAYFGPRWFELWGAARQARVPRLIMNRDFRRTVWQTSHDVAAIDC